MIYVSIWFFVMLIYVKWHFLNFQIYMFDEIIKLKNILCYEQLYFISF
jgi:hypothetical protein